MAWFKLWMPDGTSYLDTREQGWTVSASVDTFPVPEADVEEVEIPGRSGSVVIPNNRWRNVERPFSVYIPEFETGFHDAVQQLLSCSNGYYMLQDSANFGGTKYYMARVKGVEVRSTSTYHRSGVLDIVFDCQPQRWYLDGSVWHTSSGPASDWISWGTQQVYVENGTSHDAPMAVKLTGNGTLVFPAYNPAPRVTAWTISTYPSSYGSIVLDSYARSVYFTDSRENAWPYVSYSIGPGLGLWPIVEQKNGNLTGLLGLSWGSGFTDVAVMPRWWEL